MNQDLLIDRSGDVWTFTLNRPGKRNALSASLVDRLLEGVEQARTYRAKLLVFRGEGSNFSAGFDFSDLESQSEGDLLLRFVRIELLLHAVASSPCMTLALAHGKNFGAGADLFAACRRRVSTADTSFRMPGLKFGLVLGTRRFGAIVGPARARAVLERAGTFDSAQALEMGFTHCVAERAQWPDAIADALATASVLDDHSRAALFNVLGTEQPDADLAALVRSAARAGLKDRVAGNLDSK